MASKKIFPNNYMIYPGDDMRISTSDHHPEFDFEEAEIWNSSSSSVAVSSSSLDQPKKMVPTSRASSKKVGRKNSIDITSSNSSTVAAAAAAAASSLPVNIPDWSKIYREHQIKKARDGFVDDSDGDDGGGQGNRVPPHEFLARRRGASFSVHEGIGRTLKGRDLRQVRNAIWKKVGFED